VHPTVNANINARNAKLELRRIKVYPLQSDL